MLLALLKTLRPRQWVKNLFVAAPLFFALQLTELTSVGRALAAIVLFSLVSGCVYVLNDLADVEADRAHPKKCKRPIASGLLPPTVARNFLIVAAPLLLGTAALLDLAFAGVLAGYFVLNIGYSLRLKHVAYVDVLLIATFFVMRVTAGAFAIDVPPSPWLLGCTALLAFLLGFGKRAHEMLALQNANTTRKVLANYNAPALRWLLRGLAVGVVAAYVAYTQSPQTIAQFGTNALIWTAPFPALGILRFTQLATRHTDAESPTEAMLTDRWFLANVAAYVATTVAILYFGLGS